MDIFSHALWAGAVYKAVNLKKKTGKKFNFWLAAFWGMFPDLFAFAIPFVWMFFLLISGKMHFGEWPSPETTEPIARSFPFSYLAQTLYSYSHSIFIFAIIFLIAYLLFKKSAFILGGWLLHIVMDIPTHSYKFFPTPFLWPISNWKFNGISWATPWFLILDYGLLVIIYGTLFYTSRKQKKIA